MTSAIDFFCRRLTLALLVAAAANLAHAEPDPMQLLLQADLARGGGGLAGLAWEVLARNSGSSVDEDQADQRLLVKARGEASIAEVLEPAKSRGAKILQVERNMWMTKPGLRKPVAISPRQRLTGQAATGDIAATNYAKDYGATYMRDDTSDGEPCHVLDLRSSGRQSTYDRIEYWVSSRSGLGLRADFYSLSGKKLKSATFEYGNSVGAGGSAGAPATRFISRMLISDALTDAKTELVYSKVSVRALPASDFDVGNLQ